MYIIFYLIHLSDGGQLGWFHIYANLSTVAINMTVQVLFWYNILNSGTAESSDSPAGGFRNLLIAGKQIGK